MMMINIQYLKNSLKFTPIDKFNKKNLFILVGLSLILSLQVTLIFTPLTRDEGAFLTIANGILNGNLPYRDYFDHKPPGIYYLFAGIFFLFGNSLYAAKVSVFLINIFSTICIYYIGKNLYSKDLGTIAGSFFLAATALYGGYGVFTEPPMVLFGTISIVLFLRSMSRKDNYSYFFNLTSGIFIGISVLFKQTALLILIPFFILILSTDKKLKKKAEICLFIGVGIIIPLLLVYVYFYYLKISNDFIYDVITRTFLYYPPSSFQEFIAYNYSFLSIFPILWIAAAIFSIYAMKNFMDRKTSQKEMFLLIWLFSSAIPLLVRQYDHYFIQALPPAVLAGSLSMMRLLDANKKSNVDINTKIAVFLVVTILIFPTVFSYIDEIKSSKQELIRQLEVAGYIKSISNKNEKIFILGAEPEFYFLSEREPFDKNIYFLEINSDKSNANEQPYLLNYTDSEPTYDEKELIEKIQTSNLRYIIIPNNNIRSNFYAPENVVYYVKNNYKLKNILNNIEIYEHKSPVNFYNNEYANDFWWKYTKNPVLSEGDRWSRKGVFDVSTVYLNGTYHIWYSARDFKSDSIAYANSSNGINFNKYESNPVLSRGEEGEWDGFSINRPSVVFQNGMYKMLYTGFKQNGSGTESNIGYAESVDGSHWTKYSQNPVLKVSQAWERTNIQCPNVIYDENEKIFKIWYSGGEFLEPDMIGYAYSKDGLIWTKYSGNPIFTPSRNWWESKKIGSFQVIKVNNTYYSFYNAFDNNMISRIGMAKSDDGINWTRNPNNPIISQDIPGSWDDTQVYKPAVIYKDGKWFMYYNARGLNERIGFAFNTNELVD